MAAGAVSRSEAGGVSRDQPRGDQVAEQVLPLEAAGGSLFGGGLAADEAVLRAQADVVAAPPALEGRQVVGGEADKRVAGVGLWRDEPPRVLLEQQDAV